MYCCPDLIAIWQSDIHLLPAHIQIQSADLIALAKNFQENVFSIGFNMLITNGERI